MNVDLPQSRRPQPEQTFFADPALDRAFGVVMALATEVYVLRDRLLALEKLLESKGTIAPGALDGEPGERGGSDDADRQAFVAALMEPLLGHQASRGAS